MAPDGYHRGVTTRRDRARTATLAQIKAAALAQIARDGAPALSVRGVAREIGMSPAGMYRYYASRDELLTDLLVDAYNDLADAVALAAGPDADPAIAAPPGVGAVPGDPVAALLRAIGAYRAWAVANPGRFLLIFGTPVPGYEAPPDGPTVAANRRMGQTFFVLAARAYAAGLVADPAVAHHPTPGEQAALAQLRLLAPGFPAALVPQMLGGWAQWHGLVTLEVTGQLAWVYPDATPFFTQRMQAWVNGFTGGETGSRWRARPVQRPLVDSPTDDGRPQPAAGSAG